MKINSIKKMLTVTLAVTMVLGSALTVSAADVSGNSSTGSASQSTVSGNQSTGNTGSTSSDTVSGNGSTVTETNNVVPASVASSGSSSASTGSSAASSSVQVVSANAPVSIAGTSVRTTVAGSIKVDSLQGVAVITPLAEVKASLGLTDKQTPYIIAFDTDLKKSSKAMQCVNAAADSLGASFVTAINVTLGAKENGKIVSLSNGSAGMVVGLPKKADTSKTYYVICVQPGGVVTVLQDQDDSPASVTFEIKAGLATYAVVAK